MIVSTILHYSILEKHGAVRLRKAAPDFNSKGAL